MCATEDEEDTGVVAPATFIVRAWRDAAGRLHGVVERVATGERRDFRVPTRWPRSSGKWWRAPRTAT